MQPKQKSATGTDSKASDATSTDEQQEQKTKSWGDEVIDSDVAAVVADMRAHFEETKKIRTGIQQHIANRIKRMDTVVSRLRTRLLAVASAVARATDDTETLKHETLQTAEDASLCERLHASDASAYTDPYSPSTPPVTGYFQRLLLKFEKQLEGLQHHPSPMCLACVCLCLSVCLSVCLSLCLCVSVSLCPVFIGLIAFGLFYRQSTGLPPVSSSSPSPSPRPQLRKTMQLPFRLHPRFRFALEHVSPTIPTHFFGPFPFHFAWPPLPPCFLLASACPYQRTWTTAVRSTQQQEVLQSQTQTFIDLCARAQQIHEVPHCICVSVHLHSCVCVCVCVSVSKARTVMSVFTARCFSCRCILTPCGPCNCLL